MLKSKYQDTSIQNIIEHIVTSGRGYDKRALEEEYIGYPDEPHRQFDAIKNTNLGLILTLAYRDINDGLLEEMDDKETIDLVGRINQTYQNLKKAGSEIISSLTSTAITDLIKYAIEPQKPKEEQPIKIKVDNSLCDLNLIWNNLYRTLNPNKPNLDKPTKKIEEISREDILNRLTQEDVKRFCHELDKHSGSYTSCPICNPK